MTEPCPHCGAAAPSRPRPWTSQEYADWRGITLGAAAQERYRGTGPMFARPAGRVMYDPRDVYAWWDTTKVASTAEVES